MRAAFLVLLSLSLPAFAGTSMKPFNEMNKDEINALIEQTYRSTPDARKRFLSYSERFVGVPYGLFSLGIAPKNGAEDPPIRFDEADCTTMVETLIAMSVAPDLDAATRNMAKVRYQGGKVDLRTKNDIPETQWLPNNIKAGFLIDITRKVAGDRTRINEKTVRVKQYNDEEIRQLNDLVKNDPNKALAFLRNVNSMGKKFRMERARLPYVPLEVLPQVAKDIPSGAIFSLVRESRPDKEIMVTHQGLIIQKADGPYVRHMELQKKGIDVPLAVFFKQYENSSWKVVGINLTLLNRS